MLTLQALHSSSSLLNTKIVTKHGDEKLLIRRRQRHLKFNSSQGYSRYKNDPLSTVFIYADAIFII
jgi:hypothetical protein